MMSASSKLVTCGMIEADFAICAAMVRRILGIFSRRIWPQTSRPGSPGGTTALAAPLPPAEDG